MVPPFPLALWVSVTFLCLSQSTVFIPEQCTHFPKEIKNFRWDPRHLFLQPDPYQDFRKCWRCHHTHAISCCPGLPGNSFHTWNHLLGFGTCIARPETRLGRVGQRRRLTSLMIAQPVKSGNENRHKHNHKWNTEGRASCVTLFISSVWERAEPCVFSTISEQRQGCVLGCWSALQLVKIRQWKTSLFKGIEGNIKYFSLEHLHCI